MSSAALNYISLRNGENPILSKTKKRFGSSFSLWTEKWFTNWWGLELMSWLLAALSIVAIIITLHLHNGHSLPDWPLHLTINTLLSVFSTIGEISIMYPVTECISQLKWLWFTTNSHPLDQFQAFDAASRGRFGSLRLFWKLRSFRNLVSIGATLSVITLAFGPFVQQVITTPSRLEAVGLATTPQVLGYGEDILYARYIIRRSDANTATYRCN